MKSEPEAKSAPVTPSTTTVCVMGLGYIGLPTASILANKGFHVLGVDVRPEVVQTKTASQRGHSPHKPAKGDKADRSGARPSGSVSTGWGKRFTVHRSRLSLEFRIVFW